MIPVKLIVTIVSLILLVNIATFYFYASEDPLEASKQSLVVQDLSFPPPPTNYADDPDEVKYLESFLELKEVEEGSDSSEDEEDDGEMSDDSKYPDNVVSEGSNTEEGPQFSEGEDSEDEMSEDVEESDEPDEFSQPEHIQAEKSDSSLDLRPEDLFDEHSISNKFANPDLALKLLKQLDVDSVVDRNYFSPSITFKKKYGRSKTYNDKYCEDHRAYIVNHPESVFEGKNVFTDYWVGETRKKVFPQFGAVDIIKKKNRIQGVQPDLRPDVNIWFMFSLWIYKRQVGKQYSCLTQISNHIPGHQKIYYKDHVGEALIEYARGYDSRPDCFGFTRYFPKTWVLKHKDQCEEFFAEFNSELYQKLKAERNVVYFRKIGANVHQGRGVFPVTDAEEAKIRKIYKNGNACGQVTDNNLIQYNVHNTVLVQNRKIGFRMFMLVASTNPMIAFYHDGYARLSVNEYHTNSTEASTFVTNIHLNVQLAAKGTSMEGLTEMQIQDMTFWLLNDVHDYFYSNGYVSDPHWLNTTLIPDFKKVMIHLIRMAQSGFYPQSSLYELFGLDFVMDENLDLWFIEGNTKPQIRGVVPRAKKLLNKMVYDSLEIVFSLLRSRMKRIVNYINFLTKEVAENGGDILDKEQRKKEFRIISRNTFDSEFPLGATNGFQKIIDENYSGTKRFSGLIREECL